MLFVDFECRSALNLTEVGVDAYVAHPSTEPILLGWARDGGDVEICDLTAQNPTIPTLNEGEKIYAHNSRFDRWVWNKLLTRMGAQETRVEDWLCSVALANANGLPGGLKGAAKAVGAATLKHPAGPRLLRKFCVDLVDPAEHPEDWELFCQYCRDDVAAMRGVVAACRPLALEEWQEFWVSERINDRGIMVDLEFASAARAVAEAVMADLDARFAAHFGFTLRNNHRKGPWFLERAQAALAAGMPGAEWAIELLTAGGDKPRGSASSSVRRDLLRALRAGTLKWPRDARLALLYLERAGGVAASKYKAIVNKTEGGRLRGEYSWNGAGRTGRFSSRGVQIHNLVRKYLDDESTLIETITEDVARASASRGQAP